MTELSPAAQAVLDAYEKSNDCYREEWGQLAAALRAAADQLGESRAPGVEFEHLYGRIVEVDNLLAIADELEANL